MNRFSGIFGTLFFLGILAHAQIASDGDNAIPIRNDSPINAGTNGFGSDDFNGAEVSEGLEQTDGFIESYSAWYRFRTDASVQLGFNIHVIPTLLSG